MSGNPQNSNTKAPVRLPRLAGRGIKLCYLASAIIAISATPCARADDAPAAEGGQLEEITVTAQKREQSLQDVPISITAFAGNQLRAFGQTQSIDPARQTPGLLFTSTASGSVTTLPTIRGVSQNDYSIHQELPKAVYVDEVYLSA